MMNVQSQVSTQKKMKGFLQISHINIYIHKRQSFSNYHVGRTAGRIEFQNENAHHAISLAPLSIWLIENQVENCSLKLISL